MDETVETSLLQFQANYLCKYSCGKPQNAIKDRQNGKFKCTKQTQLICFSVQELNRKLYEC